MLFDSVGLGWVWSLCNVAWCRAECGADNVPLWALSAVVVWETGFVVGLFAVFILVPRLLRDCMMKLHSLWSMGFHLLWICTAGLHSRTLSHACMPDGRARKEHQSSGRDVQFVQKALCNCYDVSEGEWQGVQDLAHC